MWGAVYVVPLQRGRLNWKREHCVIDRVCDSHAVGCVAVAMVATFVLDS